MSQFVNYNKRSVKLPPGCKELSDLLKPKSLRKIHGPLLGAQPVVLHEDSVFETLANIQEHIAMVFQSRAEVFSLTISPPDSQLSLHIFCGKGVGPFAFAEFRKDAELEQAMRGFFGRHGLQAPEDSGVPGPFDTDLPRSFIYSIMPLPTESLSLSRIVADLFRDVCGLDDKSKLKFHHVEVAAA
jgi:hypothetical protein